MRPIVCATRGGEVSRRTQEHAIALARECGAELVFLCVVDPSFAGHLDERLEQALTDELKRLGRSLLGIAKARAEKRGVVARTDVRCGPVWQNIETYLREVNAGTLVIGASRIDSTLQAFGTGEVSDLAEKLRQSTDVEVVLVA